MRQQTFAEESFEKFRKKTRKEQFLDEMELIIPWQELTAAIEPFYPNCSGLIICTRKIWLMSLIYVLKN